MLRPVALLVAAFLTTAPTSSAAAQESGGHILALPRILEIVSERYIGEVIDVDLDGQLERKDDDDDFVYEVRLLTRNGNILRIRIDAEDGELVGVDGHGFIEALRP